MNPYPTRDTNANQVYVMLTNHKDSFSWKFRSSWPATGMQIGSESGIALGCDGKHRLTKFVHFNPATHAEEQTSQQAEEGHAEDAEPDGQAAAKLASIDATHRCT